MSSSATLNPEQFEEQLSLFAPPEAKPRPQEPKYAQLHLPFPTTQPSAPKIDWSTPMTQSHWAGSLRHQRALEGSR